jgi:hypothetical protein
MIGDWGLFGLLIDDWRLAICDWEKGHGCEGIKE